MTNPRTITKILYLKTIAWTAYYLHRFTCRNKQYHLHYWGHVLIEHRPKGYRK